MPSISSPKVMGDRASGRATVHVVIPVKDRWGFTRACLRSLEGQTYTERRVIVVDDGSTDGTSERLRVEFPDVLVIEGDGQLWWAGATARGIASVLSECSPEDFVLTLNNDTTVPPEFIENLVAVFDAEGERALVGGVTVDIEDHDSIVDGGPTIRWATARTYLEHAGESLAAVVGGGVSVVYPDALSGRGMLIPVACLLEVGNFDEERLPHYAADYEFSTRAARAGYRLVVSYAAPVYSEVTATGVTTRHGRLPWNQFVRMFLSRRSPACLLYRWRFGLLAAPRRLVVQFVVLDTLRVIVGGLRDQMRGDRAPAS